MPEKNPSKEKLSKNSSYNKKYCGRFAPSPTGPLHFGSLIAAVASYLDAKKNNGKWLLRIEDIDPPREVKGASSEILRVLEDFGFEWNNDKIYQSEKIEIFNDIVSDLLNKKKAYYCGCSRKEIRAISRETPAGFIYPGTCRDGLPEGKSKRSIRIKTDNSDIIFKDLIRGKMVHNISEISGDFIIKRADGLISYNLAVVIDDYLSKITHIVRGNDLFLCTPQQIHINNILGYPVPQFGHFPLAVHNSHKLSKQTHAPAINSKNKIELLIRALNFLGQNPPKELYAENIDSIWNWSIENWNIGKVPTIESFEVERE